LLLLIGNYSYEALASPLLFDLVLNITKYVQLGENESVYDRWLKNDAKNNRPKYFFLKEVLRFKFYSIFLTKFKHHEVERKW
jgi:hypothetical protein